MRLVLSYEFGDGYTFVSQAHEPFAYPSKEEAEQAIKEAIQSKRSGDISLGALSIPAYALKEGYEIYTLDEWFDTYS